MPKSSSERRGRDAKNPAAFGEALRRALADRGMTQQELAHCIGLSSQSVVSQWLSGTHEPSPQRVFAVERTLVLRPGQLSRLLGYLPVGAVPAVDVESAVKADPQLTAQQREAVLAVYRVLRGRRADRRRPR